MKSLILISFLVSSFGLAEGISDLMYFKAQVGMSLKTDGSLGNTEIDHKVAAPYPITLGVGLHLSEGFSLSAEVHYETNDLEELPASITEDEVKQFAGGLNLNWHLFKIPLMDNVQPYINVGGSYAKITIDDNDYEGTGFIWHLGAGLDLRLSDYLALTAEARFNKPVSVELEDSAGVNVGEFDYSAAKFLAGIKIDL